MTNVLDRLTDAMSAAAGLSAKRTCARWPARKRRRSRPGPPRSRRPRPWYW